MSSIGESEPRAAPAATAQRILNQVSAFQYVTVPLAPTYRAIVQLFFDEMQRYVIELRPRDVLLGIQKAGYHIEASTAEELDSSLDQLVRWGNLTRAHDTDAVATIDDFYRRQHVYNLTAVGVSAHRAVIAVEAAVGKSGSLQAVMLKKIRDALQSLASEAALAEPDPDRLCGLLHDLNAAFGKLTLEANRFIGDLNQHTNAGQVDEEKFALRKQALLAYISRFVAELRRLAGEIRTGIDAVANFGVHALVSIAAQSKDLPPDLGEIEARGGWIERELEQWQGLTAWFVGASREAEPTVDRLAAVAVSAVVSLTRTLERLNDRRTQPADRAADFQTLAGWFSACDTDADAHQLWQEAFGLYSARHFHLEEADDGHDGPRVSWWDAAPASVPVSIRARGRVSQGGRAAVVPDYTDQRMWIAQTRRRERAQIDAAVDRFSQRGVMRLSDMAELDATEFDLLLSLLDEALVAPRSADGSQSTRTGDGRLNVVLSRPPAHETAHVSIRTSRGQLRCLDYRIEVRRVDLSVRETRKTETRKIEPRKIETRSEAAG